MRKAILLTACGYLLTAPALLSGATSATTTTGAAGASAATLLNQLSTAFSGGNIVHQVQLTGSATWQVGSLNDTGSATLSAASTGSSQLQLSLSSSSSRTETHSGQGTDLACTWSGEDGIVHAIDPGNCWRPVIWFLPPLSLQPSVAAQLSGSPRSRLRHCWLYHHQLPPSSGRVGPTESAGLTHQRHHAAQYRRSGPGSRHALACCAGLFHTARQ